MEEFLNWLLDVAKNLGLKLLAALVIFIVGRIVIKAVVKALRNGKMLQKMETTVAHFLCNFINISLHTILLIAVVAILGIETSSVVALLASAGVAVGLALQGSLSNLAGGIMILIFHPFRVDHFVEAGGFTGTVIDIDIF